MVAWGMNFRKRISDSFDELTNNIYIKIRHANLSGLFLG